MVVIRCRGENTDMNECLVRGAAATSTTITTTAPPPPSPCFSICPCITPLPAAPVLLPLVSAVPHPLRLSARVPQKEFSRNKEKYNEYKAIRTEEYWSTPRIEVGDSRAASVVASVKVPLVADLPTKEAR